MRKSNAIRARLLRFIQLETFTRAWRVMGLEDDVQRQLELAIIEDPKRGVVIPGAGGLRKMRFAPARWKTGKSGGTRIGYCYLEVHGTICLVAAYDHRGKADLTPDERKLAKSLIAEFQSWFDAKKVGNP